jgi:hypothetical protein
LVQQKGGKERNFYEGGAKWREGREKLQLNICLVQKRGGGEILFKCMFVNVCFTNGKDFITNLSFYH